MKKCILSAVALFSGFALAYAAQGPSAPVQEKPVMLQTANMTDIAQYGDMELVKKNPLESESFVVNTFFLKPRQILKLHKHPASDEIFYFVEGAGQYTMGDYQVLVSSGSMAYGPADSYHGIVNSGETRMVVLSVQAPKPVTTQFAENATMICPVCGQEDIIPPGTDTFVCPRCHARLRVHRTDDGKWMGTKI